MESDGFLSFLLYLCTNFGTPNRKSSNSKKLNFRKLKEFWSSGSSGVADDRLHAWNLQKTGAAELTSATPETPELLNYKGVERMRNLN